MDIEKEINEIKSRNQKVEFDKKWETSVTRRISICVLTYIVVILFTIFVNKQGNIFLNSAVPVIGFFLSTLSLDLIKRLWLNNINKNLLLWKKKK